MHKKTRVGWLKHIDFLLIDLISILISMRLAFFIWFHIIINQNYPVFQVQLQAGIGVLAVVLLVGIMGNPYQNILHRGFLVELGEVFRQRILNLAVFAVVLVATQTNVALSRGTVALMFALDSCIGYALHVGYKAVLHSRLRDHEGSEVQMLLVCSSQDAQEIVEAIHSRAYNGFYLKGIVLTDENADQSRFDGVPVVCTASSLQEYIVGAVVDEVFLSVSDEKLKDALTSMLLQAGISVHLNLLTGKTWHKNTEYGFLAGFDVLTVSNNSVAGWQLLCKRVIDIVGALFGILLCGIIYLYVAPKIKKADPGPVFFKQQRVGKNGRQFAIYKFRSMYTDAEQRKATLMKQNKMDGLMFKMDDDPRILPGIGHFIRKYSLDEFPQFYNVLKGDMSLVGTRPPTVAEFEQYSLHHKIRLSFKPGITGLWQVSGRSEITDFEQVVALDNEYIQNWNLSLDIKILMKTVLVVLTHQGAE